MELGFSVPFPYFFRFHSPCSSIVRFVSQTTRRSRMWNAVLVVSSRTPVAWVQHLSLFTSRYDIRSWNVPLGSVHDIVVSVIHDFSTAPHSLVDNVSRKYRTRSNRFIFQRLCCSLKSNIYNITIFRIFFIKDRDYNTVKI